MSDPARTPESKSARRKATQSRNKGKSRNDHAQSDQPQAGRTSNSPLNHRATNGRINYGPDTQTTSGKRRAVAAITEPQENPERYQNGSHPPANSQLATPAKQAYAGPTFHASPAASALPMPRFFSKSVPPDTQGSKLHEYPESEDGGSASRAASRPSPLASQSVQVGAREGSPLDFLLNARRKEQERQTPESCYKSLHKQGTAEYSDNGMSARPASRPDYLRRPNGRGLSSKDIFMMEMDGTNGEHDIDDLPASSTFQQRMSAAHSTPQSSATDTESNRLAQTEALKRLLFLQKPQPSGQHAHWDRPPDLFGSPQHGHEPHGQPQYTSSGFGTANGGELPRRPQHMDRLQAERQSFSNGSVSSQAPTPRPEARGYNYPYPSAAVPVKDHDIRGMENDLRRLLKLDGVSGKPS